MVEDEVNAALDKFKPEGLEIIWVERGYHSEPDILRQHLQMQIKLMEEKGCTEILLAYGLCGRGTEGLVSQRARLIIPRYDDCLNFMLCTGKREQRALCRAGVMYLTNGWCKDQGALLQMHERYVSKYGQRRGDRIMHLMFESYNSVSIIDTGCYELEPVREYGQKSADLLRLALTEEPGSNIIMEKLIAGHYDEDFIVCEPGQAITMEDFEV